MPDWRAELERRLPPAAVEAARERGLLNELAEHLADRFEDVRASGKTESEAIQIVLAELDDHEALVGELHAMRRRSPAPPPVGEPTRSLMISDLWQDVRYAVRMLRRTPGFTIVAAITLALGLGANTAIFSVVNTVLLRPLPFHDSDRLVRIYESNPGRGWNTFSASYPNYLDWVASARGFEQIAALTSTSFTLFDNDQAERVSALAATHSFLPVLGAAPILGRNFVADEDRPGGNTRVALLTYGYWQRRFGGDASIVGRTLTLTNQPFEVIGVLPETFNWGTNLDMVVPLAPDPQRSRGDHRLSVIGRLKPDTTFEQATADLVTLAANLGRQYPETNKDWTVRTLTFYDWLIPEETRRSLMIFAIAALGVFLIACGNVTSLMLARAATRRREITVRLALGARRSRIVRQLLVESTCLALLSGLIGVAVALAATRTLRAIGPASVPRLDELSVDGGVLAFGLMVSVVAGVICGLVPAFTGMQFDASESLKEMGRSGGAGAPRQRFRHALVVGQLAVSVVLLVAAGMLLRSFWQVQKVDPGFDVTRLLTLQMNLPVARYDSNAKGWAFYAQLLERLGALPNVESVAVTSGMPLIAGNTTGDVRIPGRAGDSDATVGNADWRIVSPGYFQTLRIRLRGREFIAADSTNEAGEGNWVVIVSESFAARYFPNEDAIGKTAVFVSVGKQPVTIVGVARDVRSFGLDATVAPMAYFPTPSVPRWNPVTIVIRADGDAARLVPSARSALHTLDPTIPFYNPRTAEELLNASLGSRRFVMFLTSSFATIALLLASVGLFGVMMYLVSQRAREIGVRLALGARPMHVFKSILGRGLVLTLLGAAIGVAGAIGLTPSMKAFLFEIEPLDPLTFVSAPLMLVTVAMVACYLPARRAMRVDPIHALRDE